MATTSAGVRPTASVPGTTDPVGPATPEPPDLEPVPEQPPEQRGPPTDDPPGLEPVPVPELTSNELVLEASLREDTRLSCQPRRTGLSAGALAGVECHAYAEFVDRVGAYLFRSEYDGVAAYLDRMFLAGVTPRGGDCAAGISGDSAWHPIGEGEDHDLAVERDGQFFNLGRVGCFLDEDGTANVRVTCGNGIYVGVLGRNADLAALYDWTVVAPPDPEPDIPGPIGICNGSDWLGVRGGSNGKHV